jgi:hypothetical protein
MTIKDTMHGHGFTEWQTGGGCTAYGTTYESGHYVLITDNGGASVPEDINENCIVGLYDDDGQTVISWEADSVPHALHIAKWYVSEYFTDHIENEE